MKPPTTILKVCAVLVSLRNDETLVEGSKLRTDMSRFKDSGLERLAIMEECVYRLAPLCGVTSELKE